MTTEQRRALANTTPTTDVIRDAVTYPRDRLGEPLDISGPRFDAWLAQVKRDAWAEGAEYAAARPGYYPDENPYGYEEGAHG